MLGPLDPIRVLGPLDTALLLLVIAGFLVIGHRASRGVHTDEDWSVAGRRLGFPVLVGTLVMTELNTSTLLAFSGPGFAVGLWGLSLPLVFLFGLLAYTVLVAQRWQRLGAHSIAEYFAQRFDHRLQGVASLFLLMAMLGFSATYVRSADWIFSPVLAGWWGGPVSGWLTSGLLVLMVLLATLQGGLVAVAITDFAAFLITLVVLPGLALATWYGAGGLEGVQLAFADVPPGPTLMPPSFVASLIALTTCTYLASPWYAQRMFAATDATTARRAVALSAVIVCVLYGTAVLTAVAMRAQMPGLTNPELAVPTALATFAPAGLRGLGYAVLVGVSVTTISSIWNTWVTMALTDSGRDLSGSRYATIGVALLSWVLGNTVVDDVLNKMILANVPIASLTFGIVGGLFWRRASPLGVWASIVVGFLGAVGAFILFGDAGMYTWWWAFLVLPASVVAGVLGSVVRPDPVDRKGFYAKVGEPLID